MLRRLTPTAYCCATSLLTLTLGRQRTRLGRTVDTLLLKTSGSSRTLLIPSTRHFVKKNYEMDDEKKHKVHKLEDIKTWKEYVESVEVNLKPQGDEGSQAQPNDEFNGKISLWQGDITMLQIDAITNAANKSLLGGGGVDGAIHRAAGPDLYDECEALDGCETGEAKITKGYNLPAKHVIHTVGPQGKLPELLESCYNNCFALLLENNLRSIAFPCISTGIYGYPNKDAAHVALSQTRKFLLENADKVDRIIFCIFLDKDLEIYEELLQVYFPIKADDNANDQPTAIPPSSDVENAPAPGSPAPPTPPSSN